MLPFLEETVEAAIAPASVEVFNGRLNAIQLSQQIDREAVIRVAQTLLAMTYQHSSKELPAAIAIHLTTLPGGQDWFDGR